jgi:hypothetical protein
MTLWSIARSPLIMGGDLTKLDAGTRSLLTNDEVIAVDQRSRAGHELFNRDGQVAWVADVPGSSDKYVALFNIRDQGAATRPDMAVAVRFADLGLPGRCRVRDLWAKKNLGVFASQFAPAIAWHSAGLYRVSPEQE